MLQPLTTSGRRSDNAVEVGIVKAIEWEGGCSTPAEIHNDEIRPFAVDRIQRLAAWGPERDLLPSSAAPAQHA